MESEEPKNASYDGEESDEGDSNDDYFIYSDDSESLSDAYFGPQNNNTTTGDSPSYGSLLGSSPVRKSRQRQLYHQPPIMEDSEVTQSTSLLGTSHRLNQTNKRRQKKHGKRRRKGGQHQHLREQREHTVTQIRGEPQSTTEYYDKLWSIIFLLQLFFVLFSAGWTLLKPVPTTLSSNSDIPSIAENNEGGRRNLQLVTARDKKVQKTPTPKRDQLPYSITGAYPVRTNEQAFVLNQGNTAFNSTESSKAFNLTTNNVLPKDLEELQDDDVFQTKRYETNSGHVRKSQANNQVKKMDLQNPIATAPYKSPYFFRIDYQNVISIFSIAGFYAAVTSYLGFALMLSVARSMIPIVLIFTILSSLCWGIFGLAFFPNSIITFLGWSLFGLSSGYAAVAWKRIPFCSINLYTAISALRDTSGILFVGMGSLVVTFIWLAIWLVALIGIFNSSNVKECKQSQMDCHTHIVLEQGCYLELAILAVSLVWTCLVLKNIVRATISGSCGAWWFGVHGNPQLCFDSIVWNHVVKSCTTSLGSICLGSFLELPMQIMLIFGQLICCSSFDLCEVEEPSSQNSESEDIRRVPFMQWLTELVQCCNRWSYTYIGIYSYSFFHGGKKAFQLFRARGWMPIARESLVESTLLMASVVIGGTCGLFAVLVEEVDGYTFTSFHQPIMTTFVIGTTTGEYFNDKTEKN
jgi:hypothetical protein